MAVSETPWSKFSAADYSVEQWHRACIAHDHEGPATTKNQCKLPVREPTGMLNRAGVHAAAAALAGARGGVKLSVSERITANRALSGYYKQLGEKPPEPKKPAFLKHDDTQEILDRVTSRSAVNDWLAHFGIKGMRWGMRKENVLGNTNSSSGGVSISTNGNVTRLTSPSFQVAKGTNFNDLGALHSNPEVMKKFNSAADKLDEKSHSVWDSKTPAYSKYELEIDSKTSSVKVHLYLKPYKDGEVTLTDKMGFRKKVKSALSTLADLVPPEAIVGMGMVTHIDMSPSKNLSAFLAHHGIKGMRWGVRRQRSSDGTVSGGTKEDDSPDAASTAGVKGGGGSHISADAERIINTIKKENIEMSTREMKEAVDRANQIAAYNKLFNPSAAGHRTLQQKVEQLRLQKEYRNLSKEMKPTPPVVKLIKTASAGFGAFKQIDSLLGGTLSSGLTRKLGLTTISASDKLKGENELINLKRVNIRSKAELNELTALKGAIARGDSPSLAKGYKGAGKRRKAGPGIRSIEELAGVVSPGSR